MTTSAGGLVVAMAQIDAVVGDIEGNARRAVAAARAASARDGARLAVLPELSLLGYPPDDLLLRPDLPERVARAIAGIAAALEGEGVAVMVGRSLYAEAGCYNAVTAIDRGRIIADARKRLLPNYGVFDEKRYFEAGDQPCVFDLDGRRVGVIVCEDIWAPGPAAAVAAEGAELIVCPNASPYHADKPAERLDVARERVAATGRPLVYVNQVGGQDDLVFDGGSFVVDASGAVVAALPRFREAGGAVALAPSGGLQGVGATPGRAAAPELEASIYGALELAVRDYVDKNGFATVFVGLSGGVDSALTLAVAVDAIGPERVTAVLMPSRYTARISLEDAGEICRRLGVRSWTLSIEAPFEAFVQTLAEPFAGREADAAEENLQARCRGVLLMALANKLSGIVLATGNKSEMAVGYATLYGDMVGGFAPLKDVSKTRVYALARWRNDRVGGPVIPERVLERAPSAELAADQADTDSLPPYDVLDPILEALVERDGSVEELAEAGYPEETVRRVARMVVASEYKRRQAPPGPKVSRRAFGRERRYPITSRYPFE